MKKWYVITAIALGIILYLLHITRFPYDPLQLINAGYVEGVVLDNATLPDCHWDNKLMGEGNSCDRHGRFEIVKDDGTKAGINIYQMDNVFYNTLYGRPLISCFGKMTGFTNNIISPGDRIKMFGKKYTGWVKEDKYNVKGVVDRNTIGAYKYIDYYNCDSAFFYVKKIN